MCLRRPLQNCFKLLFGYPDPALSLALPRCLKICRRCEISHVVRLIQFDPYPFNPNHICPPGFLHAHSSFYLVKTSTLSSNAVWATPPESGETPCPRSPPQTRSPKRLPHSGSELAGLGTFPIRLAATSHAPRRVKDPLMFLNATLPRWIPYIPTSHIYIASLCCFNPTQLPSLPK